MRKIITITGFVLIFVLIGIHISNAATINGVYAYNGVFDSRTGKINPSILSNPSVDGFVAYFGWSDIEPKKGVYDWKQVDDFISQAESVNKKVAIAIRPGRSAPDWVYEAGAKSIPFVWSFSYGLPYCQIVSIPVPWDSVYLSKWTDFIKAFGARYDSNLTISHIEASGISYNTPETDLPSTDVPESINNGQCMSKNYVSEWQAVGYTRTKIENAWNQIADAWNSAFPDKPWGPLLVPGGFPRLDENGNIIQWSAKDYQITKYILDNGVKNYGARFVGQTNGLSDFYVFPDLSPVSKQISTGYQTLWFATNDPVCKMNNNISPCDAEKVLKKTVKDGINADAKFIEIYDVDILNPSLSKIISRAHLKLVK